MSCIGIGHHRCESLNKECGQSVAWIGDSVFLLKCWVCKVSCSLSREVFNCFLVVGLFYWQQNIFQRTTSLVLRNYLTSSWNFFSPPGPAGVRVRHLRRGRLGDGVVVHDRHDVPRSAVDRRTVAVARQLGHPRHRRKARDVFSEAVWSSRRLAAVFASILLNRSGVGLVPHYKEASNKFQLVPLDSCPSWITKLSNDWQA